MSTFPSEDPCMGSPKFHRTAAGDLPLDWTAEALGAHVRITSGESPSKFRFEGSGTPFFKVDQLNNDSKYLATTPYFFAGPESVPAGSVVFPKRGASILLNKIRIFAADSYMDTNLMALTPISRIDSEFLYYTLEHIQLWRFADTASIPQINNKHVKPLPIPIPGEEEQRAIAAVLANVDDFLKKTDALLVKKRDLKEAAMQQLLTGRVRLAGHGREWKQASLGELFTFKNGLNKAKQFFGFGTPIVNYMDVYNRPKIRASCVEGRVSLSVDEIKSFDVRRGDVLFTRTSETPEEVGMAAVMLDEPSQTVFSGFVLRARPRNDELCDEFKAYCFRSSFVRNQIISKSTYTTRALTNGRQLSAVILPIPPKSEQAAIAAALSSMDDEVAALELRRKKTLALKQAMTQQLLTGRIRLI